MIILVYQFLFQDLEMRRSSKTTSCFASSQVKTVSANQNNNNKSKNSNKVYIFNFYMCSNFRKFACSLIRKNQKIQIIKFKSLKRKKNKRKNTAEEDEEVKKQNKLTKTKQMKKIHQKKMKR